MICLHTPNLKKKLALALSGLVLTTSLTLSALPAAEAFDWSNAIGSIVLVSAQYSMLNKQVAYLDGKGRGEYLDQDRKSTRLNSSHGDESRMPSSA